MCLRSVGLDAKWVGFFFWCEAVCARASNLYMFRVGLLLNIWRYSIHNNWYMSCFYVDWLLAGSELNSEWNL
jgi:hypothetical protein